MTTRPIRNLDDETSEILTDREIQEEILLSLKIILLHFEEITNHEFTESDVEE